MGSASDCHRPLLGGLDFDSRTGYSGNLRRRGGGTLTGLATRNRDNQKVLYTCLHVMA